MVVFTVTVTSTAVVVLEGSSPQLSLLAALIWLPAASASWASAGEGRARRVVDAPKDTPSCEFIATSDALNETSLPSTRPETEPLYRSSTAENWVPETGTSMLNVRSTSVVSPAKSSTQPSAGHSMFAQSLLLPGSVYS
eukprot:CAMPEP_0180312246 /NCGR_PEP_ID=MMETSP0988-20121125/30710_1 /TAXON_ID=697907 /ORGANISM="non described non described, Strain CCMP2293" /LENGTH=138 /DNA_ID=CAMNT_0022296439 /DNA_START=780 /DNA_END=1196 /DNA_ORIENTATION=+